MKTKKSISAFCLRLVLIMLLTAFLFSGCSIQKRIYLSGYNIEWHTKTDKTNLQKSNDDQSASAHIKKIERKKIKEIEIKNDDELLASNENNLLVIKKQKKPLITSRIINQKNDNAIINPSEEKSKTEHNAEKKKLNVFALLGLIFGSISLIAIIMLFFPLAMPAFGILCVIWIFSSIVGVILSITGLVSCLKNREKYKGLWLSIIGLALILLAIILLLMLFFWAITL